jgi:hypothetical protein
MTTPSAEPAAEPTFLSRGWPLIAGGLAVLAAAVLLFVFWKPLIAWGSWINAADQPEYRKKLEEEQDPDLVPRMVAAMRDPSRGDRVRIALGQILIESKNRVREVEAALTDPDLDVRRIALAVLRSQTFFSRSYLDDPEWGIEKTVVQWLTTPGTKGRRDAVDTMVAVWPPSRPGKPSTVPPEALAALVTIVEGAQGKGSAAGTDLDVGALRGSAASALAAYRHCPGAAALLASARVETEPTALLREMQALANFLDAEGAPCKDVVAEDGVLDVVDRALRHADDEQPTDRAVRMGAIQLVMNHAKWASPARIEAVRKSLDPARNQTERRTAFEALVTLKDKEVLAEYERWFHDPSTLVRSSAATKVVYGSGDLAPEPFLSCLVGYARNETDPAAIGNFRNVAQKLRTIAKRWVGLKGLEDAAPSLPDEVSKALAELYKTGSFRGVTREQWGDAQWRWLAEHEGYTTPADVEAAISARDAFWSKAHAGDVKGAREALDRAPFPDRALWGYERGWLVANRKT